MQRGRRSLRGKDRPAPTQCLQTQCFDPLVRNCVACSLLRTTGPRLGKSRAAPTHGARARGSPGAGRRAAEVPESLDVDTTLSPGTLDATAPIWLLPSEDPAATPPTHSVPVPATELGSTELVTTKTAGPELQ
nr:PREDICTED: tumor necrosis factor receptor superfamily member 13C [Bos mutus]